MTAILAVPLAVGAIWGFAVEARRLRVERITAGIPNLPGDLDGETIAVLGDIQIGMPLGNQSVAARAIRRIIAERPAAVLLAGDHILHTGGDARARITGTASLLLPLTAAAIPTFAVLGNHDYDHEPDEPRPEPLQDQVATALQQIGITVLRNQSAAVPRRRSWPGSGLRVIGLGEHRAEDDHVAAAFEGVPPDAPRIVLMHNPDTFRLLPPGTAPLAVAGHTHGGQVKIRPDAATPCWMRLARMPPDLGRGSGWLPDGFGAPGNRLYVTRGIGFSGAPIRINSTPELTIFTLRRA